MRLVANKPAWVRVYAQSLRREICHGIADDRAQVIRVPLVPGRHPHPQRDGRPVRVGDRVLCAGAVQHHGNPELRDSRSRLPRHAAPDVALRHATSGREYDSHTLVVNAALKQTLRLRAILVSYNGPRTSVASTPPPPTITLRRHRPSPTRRRRRRGAADDAGQSTGWFTSAGTVPWNLPLDDPRTSAGGCSSNWDALLTRLTNERTNDGNRGDVVYCGLLPCDYPARCPGCGVGAWARQEWRPGNVRARNGDGSISNTRLRQQRGQRSELTDLRAAPLGLIEKYGLNISNGTVLSLVNTSTTCRTVSPQWMSLYQHDGLHPPSAPRSEVRGRRAMWVDKLEFREYAVQLPFPTRRTLGRSTCGSTPWSPSAGSCARPRGRRRQCGPGDAMGARPARRPT